MTEHLLPKVFKDCLGEHFQPWNISSLKEKLGQAKLLLSAHGNGLEGIAKKCPVWTFQERSGQSESTR